CTRGAFYRVSNRSRCGFADRTAFFADQKNHWIAAVVILHARDERIAAFDPMHEILLPQEIECSINRNGGRPRAPPRQTINEIISREWVRACRQSLEDPPAHRRQTLLASGADRFGVGDRVVRAAPVIVVGLGKY